MTKYDSKAADADPARFGCLNVRFSASVYPNDVLTLQSGREGAGCVLVGARTGGKTIVSNAHFEHVSSAGAARSNDVSVST